MIDEVFLKRLTRSDSPFLTNNSSSFVLASLTSSQSDMTSSPSPPNIDNAEEMAGSPELFDGVARDKREGGWDGMVGWRLWWVNSGGRSVDRMNRRLE